MQNITKRRVVFDYWLRTGRVLEDAAESPVSERKFNPWHDPDDGRFTFSGQGQYYSGGASHHPPRRRPAQSSARPTAPKSTPSPLPMSRTTEAPLGFLAESQEAGRGPATISSGRNDPGGKSYGGYQLSTKTRTLATFLAGPEFQPWAKEFEKLRPGTAEFDSQWIAAADAKPEAFRDAQRAFIMRTHYAPAAASVRRTTGWRRANTHQRS